MPFIRIFLNNKLLRQVELGDKTLTVGRTADNDIQLNSTGVSARHAILRREGKEYFIDDADSTNGVFVNNQRVQRHQLQFWDEIQIYNYVLKYMSSSRAVNESDADELGHIDKEATLVTSINSIKELQNLKKLDIGYLYWEKDDGTVTEYELGDNAFTIGKSEECDIHISKWLGPDISCRVERKGNHYYISPSQRGKVNLNGAIISEQFELQNDDLILVDGLRIRFQQITPSTIQK